jgi:hypothetical protein
VTAGVSGWNPAADAQAVDRAHHIGQARQAFAYRLIAHNAGTRQWATFDEQAGSILARVPKRGKVKIHCDGTFRIRCDGTFRIRISS